MAEGIKERKDSRKSESGACSKRSTYTRNLVMLDNICKEIILREKLYQRNWSKKYEYFRGDYFQKLLAEECKKAGLPADTFSHKVAEGLIKRSPISLELSPPIPKTSSAMVGFRSSRPECNLEFVGKMYVSPKWTLEPPLQPGEFRVTQQKFIFLG